MNTHKERFTEWLLASISTLSILSMSGIVIGFFGMVVVASLLQDYLNASTSLNAGLMLAFMRVLIICSVVQGSPLHPGHVSSKS